MWDVQVEASPFFWHDSAEPEGALMGKVEDEQQE